MSAHTPDAWAEAEASRIVGIIQDLSVSAADAEAIQWWDRKSIQSR
jgi:hypothetical protein